MSGTGFVLAINIFIAGLFAASFAMVAIKNRALAGATWFSFAYGLGMASPALELFLPYQANPFWVGYGVFLASTGAFALAAAGIARHFMLPVPWLLIGCIYLFVVATGPITIQVPRESLFRMFLYQAPFCALNLVGSVLIWKSRQRGTLDRLAMVLTSLSALHFLGKPLLGAVLGTGADPQSYITSLYGIISQSLGAALLISNGLLLLALLGREIVAEVTARSEIDVLSGLYNRGAFDQHAAAMLKAGTATNGTFTVILCDIDHFKSVNDTHGHAVGDLVIRHFADLLRQHFPTFLIGRVGGEEFAVLAPAPLQVARQAAEGLRRDFMTRIADGAPDSLRCTASFGLAVASPVDNLAQSMRRADRALYQAKAKGRNRISTELPRSEYTAYTPSPLPSDRTGM